MWIDNLYMLGEEYLEEEKCLRRRIAELRRQRAESSPEEQKSLDTRLYYLICEATDCHKTGRYLMEYYGGEPR